jgi:hypothetical protein
LNLLPGTVEDLDVLVTDAPSRNQLSELADSPSRGGVG